MVDRQRAPKPGEVSRRVSRRQKRRGRLRSSALNAAAAPAADDLGRSSEKGVAVGLRTFLLVLGVSGCLAARAEDGPRPGQRPTDPQQQARIMVARQDLASAMRTADLHLILASEAEVRRALGSFAGVPEDPEELAPPGTKASRPTATDFRKLTARMASLASGSKHAKKSRMELRQAAYLAIGLLAMSEAKLPDAAEYRKQAAIELDYLISKQAAEGYFPYPADPIAPPHLRRTAAKAAREHPDKVDGGFIYLDADGVQFDTGCASFALAYGYQTLGEERFLKAAREAGDWALACPLSANWNYNSFSVWQLAKVAEVSGERKYLEGAVKLATLGVLPGLMENGRWSDQHNAKAVYHWIMVRGLVALLRVLPSEDEDAAFIRSRARLAVQARVEDVLRDGGGNSVQAYVGLAEALEFFGPEEPWERALAEIGGNNPYSAGVYARRHAAGK